MARAYSTTSFPLRLLLMVHHINHVYMLSSISKILSPYHFMYINSAYIVLQIFEMSV